MAQRIPRGGLFAGMEYHQALELVANSSQASALLRQRVSTDQQRDVLTSLQDAQVLCALQRLRVDALQDAKRFVDRP